jgi:hypothetical protein
MARKLSHNQKRKAKLKKRAQRQPHQESLAYHGAKYQGADYVPVMMATEQGIYETFVLLDGDLTDHDVEDALESLVLALRKGQLPAVGSPVSEELDSDPVVAGIRRHWAHLAERGPIPSRDDMIGVLRTLLGSVATRREMAMHPQGYLTFLKGFMREVGFSVRNLSADEAGGMLADEDSGD